ncbi:hypothetical protein ZWY2020_003793 [Hordeum vulgare]|nr:hypothetical protein ZWY2020_003793 [Hordeum vulgare]
MFKEVAAIPPGCVLSLHYSSPASSLVDGEGNATGSVRLEVFLTASRCLAGPIQNAIMTPNSCAYPAAPPAISQMAEAGSELITSEMRISASSRSSFEVGSMDRGEFYMSREVWEHAANFKCRVCGNSHELIRKYGLTCYRQCFRGNAKDIGFI